MKFGDKLRKLLEERDLSQKELSAILGMAPSTLGNYIRNEREADYETLKLFASYFDVSTDYLLDYQSGVDETGEETELLRIFRTLSPDQQDLYIEQGRAFITQNNKKEKSSAPVLKRSKTKTD